MTFGSYIGEQRKKLRISQKDMAMRLIKDDGNPISAQYLNDIEHDRRNPPPEDIMRQISEHLQVSLEYLIFLSGELPSDLRNTKATPEMVNAAFSAFRKKINEQE